MGIWMGMGMGRKCSGPLGMTAAPFPYIDSSREHRYATGGLE